MYGSTSTSDKRSATFEQADARVNNILGQLKDLTAENASPDADPHIGARKLADLTEDSLLEEVKHLKTIFYEKRKNDARAHHFVGCMLSTCAVVVLLACALWFLELSARTKIALATAIVAILLALGLAFYKHRHSAKNKESEMTKMKDELDEHHRLLNDARHPPEGCAWGQRADKQRLKRIMRLDEQNHDFREKLGFDTKKKTKGGALAQRLKRKVGHSKVDPENRVAEAMMQTMLTRSKAFQKLLQRHRVKVSECHEVELNGLYALDGKMQFKDGAEWAVLEDGKLDAEDMYRNQHGAMLYFDDGKWRIAMIKDTSEQPLTITPPVPLPWLYSLGEYGRALPGQGTDAKMQKRPGGADSKAKGQKAKPGGTELTIRVTHDKSFDPSGNTQPGKISDRITQQARQKIGARLVQERITHASVADVQAWLETVGLQEAALEKTKDSFEKHDIDGIALLMLKPEQLGSPGAKDTNKDYLEIEPLGARQRLWFFIAKVCHNETQNPDCARVGIGADAESQRLEQFIVMHECQAESSLLGKNQNRQPPLQSVAGEVRAALAMEPEFSRAFASDIEEGADATETPQQLLVMVGSDTEGKTRNPMTYEKEKTTA